MPSEITAIVVDDENLVAAAIGHSCERVPRVKIVGLGHNGREAINLIQTLTPDIAVVDLVMPILNGIEVAAHVRQHDIHTRVILLTGYRDENLFRRAIRSGASGYLLKASHEDELETAIRVVAGGHTYITPEIADALVEDGGDEFRGTCELERLTPRHRQILQLIAEGNKTKDIATLLEIAVKTVENERAELMRRLSVHDSTALVRFAIRHKLIDIDKD